MTSPKSQFFFFSKKPLLFSQSLANLPNFRLPASISTKFWETSNGFFKIKKWLKHMHCLFFFYLFSKPRNTLKFRSSKSWDVLKFLALKPRARTYSLNWHPWWLIPNTTSKMLKGQKTKSKLFFFLTIFLLSEPFFGILAYCWTPLSHVSSSRELASTGGLIR